MPKDDVLKVARGELGYTENPPGSNRVKYWDEYDPTWQGQPWCVSGLWWVFKHAGESSAFFGGAKTASCKTLRNWYKAQGQTVPKADGIAGDLAFCNFNGGPLPEHVELIVARKSYGWYQTIGFNTSPGEEGSQDNGGCVALKTRHISQIVEVCRPVYKEEIIVKPDDLNEHWAESSCRKAKAKAVMKGYPDGDWKPDKEVTRAELAVILDRLGLLDD